MANLNEVRLIGNLTRDPELRALPSGQSVCSFGVATNESYRDRDGNQKENTTFVDVTAWGNLGENVNKYLRKGSMVYIGGKLRYETWEDKQTGNKRSKLTVTARDVQFLDKPEGRGGDQQVRTQPVRPQEPAPTHGGGESWDSPDLGEPPF